MGGSLEFIESFVDLEGGGGGGVGLEGLGFRTLGPYRAVDLRRASAHILRQDPGLLFLKISAANPKP